MNRKAFQQLLRKYLDGSCTAEERLMVDQWYELLDNRGYTAFSSEKLQEIEDRLWEKVQLSTTHAADNAYPGKAKIIQWRFVAVASFAGILLLGGVLWFYSERQAIGADLPVSAKADKGYLNESNDTKSPKEIQLEDGSSVVISPSSKLAFPKHFSRARREVYLEGEGFFKVSKDANRPFFVYSKQLVTQALGTSFNIRNTQGKVEVLVKTGKVAVYENKEQMMLNEVQQKSNGVIITPNQKVTYYQQERHFITSIADQPVPILKEPGDPKKVRPDFNYNETPLETVLQDLQNTYGLEIVVEKEEIKNCLFTGDLTDENLFDKLEGICLVFGADYELKGTKILLKGGKNCTVN